MKVVGERMIGDQSMWLSLVVAVCEAGVIVAKLRGRRIQLFVWNLF